MADNFQMQLSFRAVPNDPNVFEFIIATPLLRSQFLIPRALVNQLRIELERALMQKSQ